MLDGLATVDIASSGRKFIDVVISSTRNEFAVWVNSWWSEDQRGQTDHLPDRLRLGEWWRRTGSLWRLDR